MRRFQRSNVFGPPRIMRVCACYVRMYVILYLDVNLISSAHPASRALPCMRSSLVTGSKDLQLSRLIFVQISLRGCLYTLLFRVCRDGLLHTAAVRQVLAVYSGHLPPTTATAATSSYRRVPVTSRARRRHFGPSELPGSTSTKCTRFRRRYASRTSRLARPNRFVPPRTRVLDVVR